MLKTSIPTIEISVLIDFISVSIIKSFAPLTVLIVSWKVSGFATLTVTILKLSTTSLLLLAKKFILYPWTPLPLVLLSPSVKIG